MALLSTSYIFSWSRWNATRDFREIVLQFKEAHGCIAKEVTESRLLFDYYSNIVFKLKLITEKILIIFFFQRTNLTLLVTPSRTMRIRCTEVSSEFSDLPLEDQDTKVKRK